MIYLLEEELDERFASLLVNRFVCHVNIEHGIKDKLVSLFVLGQIHFTSVVTQKNEEH